MCVCVCVCVVIKPPDLTSETFSRTLANRHKVNSHPCGDRLIFIYIFYGSTSMTKGPEANANAVQSAGQRPSERPGTGFTRAWPAGRLN